MTTRYALMREDEFGKERLLGRCVDVVGLFVDPPILPLETLTLGGCTLTEPFRDTGGRPLVDGGRLGDLQIAVWGAERPLDWWVLSDVTVTAHVTDPSDCALTEISVQARVSEPARGRAEPFEATRFVLYQDGERVGTCRSVTGLYVDRLEPSPVPLDILGCTMSEELAAVLADPDEGEWFTLAALDRRGRPMARRNLLLRVAEVQASDFGEGLVDIALFCGVSDPPPLVASQVWDDWFEGAPDVFGTWMRYSAAGRMEWLMLALGNNIGSKPNVSGKTYQVASEGVTEVCGLHCALGEAVRGPGGYYGWGLDSLNDCLGGGFGVVPPFTVVWRNAEEVRRSLADGQVGNVDGAPYFEQVVRILERNGVTVVLA